MERFYRKKSGAGQTLMSSLFTLFLIFFLALTSFAQMKPTEIGKDYLVKFYMKDTSEFYGIVLQKPVPNRFIVATRYGRLEIPASDINYAVDYRFNFVMYEDIKKAAIANMTNVEKKNLSVYLNYNRYETKSVLFTSNTETYRGFRYMFDDSAHVILATDWGDLFFTYPDIKKIDNYSGTNDTRSDFYSKEYLALVDPRHWQGYITPNAMPMGVGKASLNDYLIASLQFNYGITDWLSANIGGAFIPFLPNTVKVATGGIKVTPYSEGRWHISAGAQGLYSEVTKETRLFFPFAVATYGTVDANLSVLGGYAMKEETDTITYQAQNPLLAFMGAARVGENIKIIGEMFFIDEYPVVPFMATLRYFSQKFTVDVGVVFSLFKAGEKHSNETIGETIFGVSEFPIVPVIAASYHF
jgi:hypothetical protein